MHVNKCADGGYLVAGTATIPSDATDFQVNGLAVVGCGRLRCQHGYWLCRFPLPLRDGDAAVVAKVALGYLADTNVTTRALAFEFFTQRGSKAADRRIPAILEAAPDLVHDVPNTVTRYSVDKTLESTAWRASSDLRS